ncbi:DUF1559 domain-containing protein [Lacipirellula sp.]|uniref:DUF1559 family PulG-like putative transporter n=1 Tax=Lacipirellula sp. TaxID=2691419 RepID=UPI003D0D5EE4
MTATTPRRPRLIGFTLVELLVVIAIIGVLVALLLPAVQAARESARNSQCKNSLKQIGLAMLNFESAKKEFPSGGWGFRWMGDPDAGTGPRQPGGWIYQVAPYIEQAGVTHIGSGTKGQIKYDALAAQRAAIVPMFYCPSRRPPNALPSVEMCFNAGNPATEARTDYAANGGARYVSTAAGPPPNADYTDCAVGFPNCAWTQSNDTINAFTGVVTARLGAKLRQFSDGASNTFMVGEKYVPEAFYENVSYRSITVGSANAGDDNPGDNSSMYQGYDQDTVRWPSGEIDNNGIASGNLPLRDSQFGANSQTYAPGGHQSMGSPHAGGVNLVYADGSVHAISFDVGPLVWNGLADRQDGNVAQ